MTDQAPIENPFKRKLGAGESVFMMLIRHLRTPDAAMIVRECGFDGFYVDREHGMFSDRETSALCESGLMMGLMPAVRIRAGAPSDIQSALDGGALGIIVPHVANAAEAANAVRYVKHPPLGDRSVSTLGPTLRFRQLPVAETVRIQNELTMVFAQLESPEGVANADAIAAVPGIDALMIGATDLSTVLGVPGEVRHPKVKEAYFAAAAAARRHGKHFVGGGAGGPELGELAKHGAKIFMGGSDFGYLMASAKQASASMKSAVEGAQQ